MPSKLNASQKYLYVHVYNIFISLLYTYMYTTLHR